jgi:hypothetical protein
MERIPLRRALALVIAALVAAHYAVLLVHSGLDVDTKGVLAPLDLFEERSIGTWVSAALLAAAALAAAAAAVATPRGAVRLRRGWTALAAIVVLASVDEVAGFHESIVDLMRSAVELPGALFYAAWVVPALALVAAFIAWQWRFFGLLPRPLSMRVAAAAGVYVAAAGGLEVVESALRSNTSGRDWTPFLQVLVGIEEGVEMGAVAVLLLALLRHVGALCPTWQVIVGDGGERVSVAPAARAPAPAVPARRWERDVAAARAPAPRWERDVAAARAPAPRWERDVAATRAPAPRWERDVAATRAPARL